MEKRAKSILIASIIIISISLLLAGFVIAQNSEKEEETESNEIIPISEEKLSPEKVFIQYLQEKINELPDEEKKEFEKFSKMETAEVILKAAGRFQSQNQEEVIYLEEEVEE